MIDASDFEALIAGIRQEDEKRELLIKKSRDIQRWSKQAIFSLHRREFDEASNRLAAARNCRKNKTFASEHWSFFLVRAVGEVQTFVDTNPLLGIGAYSNALEEYSEAKLLEHYLNHKCVLPKKDLPFVKTEEFCWYLGGVLDFTGELLRHAIQQATARDEKGVQQARDLVQELMGYFLQFDLRNTPLRKKFDALKYTLKKLENTLYEMSLSKGRVFPDPTIREVEEKEEEL